MRADLKVTSGPMLGTTVSLPLGKFMVGRAVDCQLRPNSDTISRYHCVFKLDEFSLRVRDMGSRNGTEVNDNRIASETQLVVGDVVSVGEMQLQVAAIQPDGTPAARPIQLPDATSEPTEGETTTIQVRESESAS